MRKTILLLSTIFVSASPIMAQGPGVDFSFEISSYEYGYKFKPLGTSVNNNFVLFYEAISGGNKYIKACTIEPAVIQKIRPALSPGPFHVLTEGFTSRKWDVVWHPVVKKFMLAYVKDNEVWARRVKLNGKPGGQSKRICDYRDDYLQLAWTKKKKFVLFLTRSGQLAAQALKKNGKKFKTEKQLTFFNSGEAYPVAAATKDNSEAVAYFAHYDGYANELTPRLISVNHKLKIYDYYAITAMQYSDSKATFVGNYDPVSKTHSIAWRFGGAAMKKLHSRYCCFNESGTMVLPPTNTPENITPTELIYDPSMERFAIGYSKYETATPMGRHTASIDHTKNYTYAYLTIYNPNGATVIKKLYVHSCYLEALGTGVGYARNGNILGVTSSSFSGPITANLKQSY